MNNEIEKSEATFVNDIKTIIRNGRQAAYSAVSAVMTETYWNIGKRIVEQEQHGKNRADYGKKLINDLSKELATLYGEGFGTSGTYFFRLTAFGSYENTLEACKRLEEIL